MNTFDIVYNMLDKNEIVSLDMNKHDNTKGYHIAFKNRLKVQYAGYDKELMYQSSLLSKDAIKRKSTIKEIF